MVSIRETANCLTERWDDVAFVIIGRNEGVRLEASLGSVLGVSRQVVYADSASTDGSVERARAAGACVVELDHSSPLNAARGRNAGLAAVRARFPQSRYVQFLDGDCVLDPEWVPAAVDFLDKNPRAAVVCGRRFEAHPESSFYNRLGDQEWNTPVGPADACGGDAMMRAEALDQVGGFNSLLMASEEPELCARLRVAGWEIWRIDAPMTEHDLGMLSFDQWWRRTIRSGYGYVQGWQATRSLPRPINAGILRSALVWMALMPLGIGTLTIVTRKPLLLLLIPALWGAQIARMVFRRGDGSLEGWRASAMIMLAKVPELIGAARAVLNSQKVRTFEYKATPQRRPQTKSST